MAYRASASTNRTKGFGLQMFSPDELQEIHYAT